MSHLVNHKNLTPLSDKNFEESGLLNSCYLLPIPFHKYSCRTLMFLSGSLTTNHAILIELFWSKALQTKLNTLHYFSFTGK